MSKHKETYILHVDGDSFFAECERVQFPHLRGKPVVVGQERGIACAMSYEAKALGITRAMPIFHIKKFFPEVTILPSHFELYTTYSERMAHVLKRYLSLVESYSIDECFGIIETDSWQSAMELTKVIKEVLQRETGLTFSFGVGRTKVLAKIASKAEKPNGLTVITPDREAFFLANTKIGKVWGIGYRTAPKLAMRGIKTALEFRDLSREYIEEAFDKSLQEIWHEMNGESVLSVGDSHETQKSLQATRTFTPPSSDESYLLSELSKNIEVAFSRLRDSELLTNRIAIFVKTKEYSYRAMEIVMPWYNLDPRHALDLVSESFKSMLRNGEVYRSTGVTLLGLIPADHCPHDLFGVQDEVVSSGKKLMNALDHIRHLYGNHSVFLGASMKAVVKRNLEDKKRKLLDPYIFDLPLPFLGEVS